MFFFFKQKTAYEMRISDWSSDVCSSDLHRDPGARGIFAHQPVVRVDAEQRPAAAVDIEHDRQFRVRDRTVEAQANAVHVHFARLRHYRATLAPRLEDAFGDLAAHRHARPGGRGMFGIGGVDRIDEAADIGVGDVVIYGAEAL